MKANIKALMMQIESGKLDSDKVKVLDFIIKRGGCSNIIHMKSLLFMSHQTLTARLSDLCDMGVVYEKDTMNGTHGRYCYEPDPEKQKENAEKREMERHRRWLKIGNKNGWLNLIK